MMDTMSGTGKVWIDRVLADMPVTVNYEERFVYAIGKFREHFLSPTQAALWRSRLTVRLQTKGDTYLTLSDFETHYGQFTKTLTNLRICDRGVNDRDAIQYYLDTLPAFLFSYLGPMATTCRTLEEVHRLASAFFRTGHQHTRHNAMAVKKAYEREHVTEVNVQHTASQNNHEKAQQQHSKPIPEHHRCFHCGESGHYQQTCPARHAKRPRTQKGVEAYNKVRKDGYNNAARGYDQQNARTFVQKRKDWMRRDNQYRQNARRNDDDENDERDPAAPPTPPSSSSSQKPQQSTVACQSVTMIDTNDGAEDDQEWEGEEEEERRVFRCDGIGLDDKVSDEKKTATSLCVPVEMNGTSVGHALVDQGANRSLMRLSAYQRYGLDTTTTMNIVNNYYVSTASNQLVPVVGRFMVKMTTDGEDFNDDAVVYVVDDREKDISCDVVVGRHTIAKSKYRLIDTLTARLCSEKDQTVYIQCKSCTPHTRRDGKKDLLPSATPAVQTKKDNSVDLPVMNIEVTKVKRRPSLGNIVKQHHQQPLDIISYLLFPSRISTSRISTSSGTARVSKERTARQA